MVNRGVKKYFTNPVLGLIIGVIYILLVDITGHIDLSLGISIICGLLYDILNRLYTKTRLGGFLSRITVVSLVLTLILHLFLRKYNLPFVAYIVFYEILMVIMLVIARLSRSYLELFFWKEQRPIEKALMGEFIETTRFVEYAFTLHIFVVLIYGFFSSNFFTYTIFDVIFYYCIPIVSLLSVIVYQEIKTNSIAKQLQKEEWLPIVTKTGEVTGRVARSVSEQMGNQFLHPVIRIVILHDGKLYLQKRANNNLVDPGCYDHALEQYMPYNKEINEVVSEYISKTLGVCSITFNFLLKYVYENESSRRLIFLFVARLQTQEQLDSLNVLEGKFWTTKQIEEEFSDDSFFSECFQLEYEYLKNTVIESEQLHRANRAL